MSGLVAELALLVLASGGIQLYLPSVANGLEWIGSADVMHASCRYETWGRGLLSRDPEEWTPWEIRQFREYDAEGRGIYGATYHTSYTSTGWVDYYNGLPVRSNYDRESDGIVDEIGLNVYDAYGKLVSRRGYASGEPSLSKRWFYDHKNRMIREDTDYEGDGIVNLRITREYGDIGEVLRDSRFSLSTGYGTEADHFYVDGRIESSQVRLYRAAGLLASEGQTHYTFDAQDRLIRRHDTGTHIDSGDTIETIETHEYDGDGNVVYSTRHDVHRDHFFDTRYVYDDRGFLSDRYSRNYVGGVAHTRYVHEGCQTPLWNVKVEIEGYGGPVPIRP